MSKSYVHVFQNLRDAFYEAEEYIAMNIGEVEKYFKSNNSYQVFLRNGECHYFMNDSTYMKWCKGRVYYDVDGIKYHSGYEVKQ